MTNYKGQDFRNMKREAFRNAQEMHNKRSSANSDIPPVNNNCETGYCNTSGISGIADGLLESLGISKAKTNNDMIIIVLMIIMLAREGADLKLLLALGYILM